MFICWESKVASATRPPSECVSAVSNGFRFVFHLRVLLQSTLAFPARISFHFPRHLKLSSCLERWVLRPRVYDIIHLNLGASSGEKEGTRSIVRYLPDRMFLVDPYLSLS